MNMKKFPHYKKIDEVPFISKEQKYEYMYFMHESKNPDFNKKCLVIQHNDPG